MSAEPYAALRGRFGNFTLITAFDTKGGFANINVGVIYLQRAVLGGAVHRLFLEFDARVAAGLWLPPPRGTLRNSRIIQLFWDQNLFNKVLLSALAGHAVHLPDDSDRPWRTANTRSLQALGRRHAYRAPLGRIGPPEGMLTAPPWYPPVGEYRWQHVDAATAGGGGEALLLAPPWLISADNSLGHRYKHWLYGAAPRPWLMLHLVCVASGEHSRILPMRLFGAWHEEAVAAELPPELARTAPRRRPLLALARGSYAAPLPPRPWARLNALHALLGGLAVLSKRTRVSRARLASLPLPSLSDLRHGNASTF